MKAEEHASATGPIGWRVWALSGVVAIAVFSPGISIAIAPLIATLVFLTAQPLSLRLDAPNILATAFAVFAAVSIIWSVNTGVSLRGAITFASLGIAFIGTRHTLRTLEEKRVVAAGYLAGCGILAGRLIVLYATRPIEHEIYNYRLNLPDVNVNYAAYAFVLAFVPLSYFWTRAIGNRVVVVAFSVILLGSISLTETRAALISVTMFGLWAGFSRFLKSPPLRTVAVTAIVGAIVVATGVADRMAPLIESLLGRSAGDWSGRLEIWPMARAWWLEHFFAGSGVSTFTNSNPLGIGAHNVILEVGAGLGLIGVALYLAFLWTTLRLADRYIAGSYIVTTIGAYLSGHWEAAPAAWLLLAVISANGPAEPDSESPPSRSKFSLRYPSVQYPRL